MENGRRQDGNIARREKAQAEKSNEETGKSSPGSLYPQVWDRRCLATKILNGILLRSKILAILRLDRCSKRTIAPRKHPKPIQLHQSAAFRIKSI